MSGYIGTAPVPQATQTRDSFTATSGQTSFATGGYTPNFLDIFLNGVKLSAADYTASNGSDVVLASGAATGDILEVVAFTTFTPADLPSGTPSIDDNGNATALTIDSSENLLVGLTATEAVGTNAGTQLRADGLVYAAVTSDAHILSRRSSDGAILNLRKDTTTVGSIGSNIGHMYLGTDDVGLRFSNTGDYIYPVTAVGGTGRDNAIGLGYNGSRFKDLYLSGGVYLGGTGSANKLDDYEEGSFNLTMTGGSGNPSATQLLGSTYVKIGKLVSFRSFGTLNNTGASGAIAFSGLPFTPTGVTIANIECNSQGTFSLSPYGYVSGTVIYIQQMRSNNTYAVVNHNVASSGEWSITGHFFTNS